MEELVQLNPNYYAIIPAFVRYNEKLSPNAKLLYGEITALCNKKGYCYASNKYFANLYKVSNNSISNWVSSLVGEGYVKIHVNREEGNQRRIWLTSHNKEIEGIQNNLETYTKKPKDNNTKNNTKNINIIKDIWNDSFKDSNVPTIISINGTRKTHLIKRFKENKWTIENWKEYLSKIMKSNFLMGEETSWSVTFDWVINPTNMNKILEGNYEKEGTKVVKPKYHFSDFKLDATGNARMGYCVTCDTSDFYDTFKIVGEDSRCCHSELKPKKETK